VPEQKDEPRPPAAKKRGARPWIAAGSGFVLAMLAYGSAVQLGLDSLPFLRFPHVEVWAGIAGALLGLTRVRSALWVVAGVVCALQLAVQKTPLVLPLYRSLVREDPPARSDAVVVLASGLQLDGELIPVAQARVAHAYELLGRGYAPRMVLTRLTPPAPSALPAVRRQMEDAGLHFPVEEIGPIVNTHDEALAVSRLVRERGWRRILLVTDPFHSRRAAATFRKAGVELLSSPCRVSGYNHATLQAGHQRLPAFHDWVKEAVGYQVYRWRGWL